jgi:hypothetical protein
VLLRRLDSATYPPEGGGETQCIATVPCRRSISVPGCRCALSDKKGLYGNLAVPRISHRPSHLRLGVASLRSVG